MRALYDVYDMKTMKENLGSIWLSSTDRQIIRERGFATILLDDVFPLAPTLTPDMEHLASQTMEVIRVGLDRRRDGTWILTSDGTAAQMAKAKSLQEQNMRFPVPISLFPG